MTLTDDAREQGVSSRTAWRWGKAGQLPGQQLATGTILLATQPPAVSRRQASQRAAIDARGSSAEHPTHLQRQAERVAASGAARGGTRWPPWPRW